MPEFIIAYHGGNKPETPEQGAAHMAKYKTWLAGLGEALVNPGTPLGPKKVVSADGVADETDSNGMSGFTVVNADDLDAALAIAQECPFLETGGTLKVAQMMQMPGM